MNFTSELPYELHTHGSGAFVIFNVGDQIALPLLTLARASLHAAGDRDHVILEFQGTEVAIEGRGLAVLLEHLLAGRVKKVARATDSACEIARIRVTESS